jgi:hypothetical protein
VQASKAVKIINFKIFGILSRGIQNASDREQKSTESSVSYLKRVAAKAAQQGGQSLLTNGNVAYTIRLHRAIQGSSAQDSSDH